MTAQRKHRVWTDEQRQHQSRKLRERQIWLKSTGPRTALGKLISSRNARNDSYAERMEMKQIKHYLRTQKSYTDLLKFFIKQGDRLRVRQQILINFKIKILENELIDLDAKIRRGFDVESNIIPFPPPFPPLPP